MDETVSSRDAENALAEINDVMALTRRSMAYAGTDTILMLWGAIWFVGFLFSQFGPSGILIGFTWLILDCIGMLGTYLVIRKSSREVKSPLSSRIGIFWFFLFLFAYVWVALLNPQSMILKFSASGALPSECIRPVAYLCTIIMFAYVVMGLWLQATYLIVTGLIVTGFTLVGYFFLQPWFWGWMGIMGGGALFTSGVYVRKQWR